MVGEEPAKCAISWLVVAWETCSLITGDASVNKVHCVCSHGWPPEAVFIEGGESL